MARIISLVNNKGGVGKTTSTLNIGVGLARNKKKVLLIDIDPQANLSVSLGVDILKYDAEKKSICEVLTREIATKDAIINVNGVDLIPSNIRLTNIELYLGGIIGRESILKNKLQEVQAAYDYILVDCPPSLNLLTLNSLGASTEIFIPIEAEYLALQGTKQLTDIVDLVTREINPTLRITGVFLTKYDKRKRLNNDVFAAIDKAFKGVMFKTLINTNVKLAEAPSHRKDIYSYDKFSKGASDYSKLVKEIIKQERSITNG